jgi:Fe-S oxidoreductase
MARLLAASRLGGAANAAMATPGVHQLAAWLGGVEPREFPKFAAQDLQRWNAARSSGSDGRLGTVVLWPDTFTNYFHPDVGRAAVSVLESAGWRVEIPGERLCCGLTWISTGQLGIARRKLRRSVAALAEHVRAGGFVVGLEPSCTAVFRSDAQELFPDDQDVHRLGDHVVTLAELLTEHTPGWQPPPLTGDVLAQVHCHQHAIMGYDADAKLLAGAGAQLEQLESGCCGLAGNFGFQRGHLEVSKACAEHVLLPRLRSAPEDSVVLADGFSCRTQIAELAGGRKARHLAELLASGLRFGSSQPGTSAE